MSDIGANPRPMPVRVPPLARDFPPRKNFLEESRMTHVVCQEDGEFCQRDRSMSDVDQLPEDMGVLWLSDGGNLLHPIVIQEDMERQSSVHGSERHLPDQCHAAKHPILHRAATGGEMGDFSLHQVPPRISSQSCPHIGPSRLTCLLLAGCACEGRSRGHASAQLVARWGCVLRTRSSRERGSARLEFCAWVVCRGAEGHVASTMVWAHARRGAAARCCVAIRRLRWGRRTSFIAIGLTSSLASSHTPTPCTALMVEYILDD